MPNKRHSLTEHFQQTAFLRGVSNWALEQVCSLIFAAKTVWVFNVKLPKQFADIKKMLKAIKQTLYCI